MDLVSIYTPRPVEEGSGVRETFSPRPVGEGLGVRETFPPRPVGEGSGVRETFPSRPVGEGSGVRATPTASLRGKCKQKESVPYYQLQKTYYCHLYCFAEG
jgi:hypothetical protein